MYSKSGERVSNLPLFEFGSGRFGSNETLSSDTLPPPASFTSAGSTCCGMLVDTLRVATAAMAWKFVRTSVGLFCWRRLLSRQRWRPIRL
jgi:hypothetical protein